MRREDGTVLVDLHLHSRASGTATNWWVKGLGADVEARESYTPPEDAYRMAKKAGMDFVTLTDHETIEGALTLAYHPDFFVGEEVTAYLPEEDGYVDVLVYGLDPEVHREAQSRRHDAHELVGYLREAGVVHVLAHPIYAMPGPLDRRAVEKRLVMFGLWEFTNGSRPAQQNRLARECIRPGVSGLVADPGDEEAFFSKVELLIEDPRLRERMGLAGRGFAASMSWEAVLDGLIELHTRLARGEARGGYSGRGQQPSRGEFAHKSETHS